MYGPKLKRDRAIVRSPVLQPQTLNQATGKLRARLVKSLDNAVFTYWVITLKTTMTITDSLKLKSLLDCRSDLSYLPMEEIYPVSDR